MPAMEGGGGDKIRSRTQSQNVCVYVCTYVCISGPFLPLPILFLPFPPFINLLPFSLTLSFQMLRRMDGRFGRVKTEHDTFLWTTVSETALIGDRLQLVQCTSEIVSCPPLPYPSMQTLDPHSGKTREL